MGIPLNSPRVNRELSALLPIKFRKGSELWTLGKALTMRLTPLLVALFGYIYCQETFVG
jgi:hypothetical protein